MRDESHGVFAEDIASAHLSEPVDLTITHIQRRGDGQDVWVLALTEMRDRKLRANESATRVD